METIAPPPPPARVPPTPKELQSTDAAFVEVWAARHSLPGEQRFHARYGVRLWERHYRVNYYSKETNAPTRSFFVTMAGEAQELELRVHERQ